MSNAVSPVGPARIAVEPGAEKRAFPRVALTLPIRLLVGGTQYVGTLKDISVNGAALECVARPQLGQVALAYVDGIARLEGRVVRLFKRGFALRFEVSDRMRGRIAERIDDMLGVSIEAGSEGRDRPTPRWAGLSSECRCVLEGGEELVVKVLDVSLVGASFESLHRPAIGSTVTLRGAEGQVIRHTTIGFAIEFPDYWRRVSPWGGYRQL